MFGYTNMRYREIIPFGALALISSTLLALATLIEYPKRPDLPIGAPRHLVIERLGLPDYTHNITGEELSNFPADRKPQFGRQLADSELVEIWGYVLSRDVAANVYFDRSGTVADTVVFRREIMI